MLLNEVSTLANERVQAAIGANLDLDPAAVALKLAGTDLPGRLIAGQVKVLAKAKKKLPTFFKNQCLIPPRAFEQSSSEAAAALKLPLSGERLLDLTAGLGVDVLQFAKHFKQVTACDANPVLAAVHAHNAPKLGLKNVTWHTVRAEEFLRQYQGPEFDWVYLDPDRRDEAGNRKFLLEDLQPNLLEIQEALLRVGKRVMVKLAPTFDHREAIRTLPNISRVLVNSLDGEVKELLVVMEREKVEEVKVHSRMQRGENLFEFGMGLKSDPSVAQLLHQPEEIFHSSVKPIFLLEADPALYKTGMFPAWVSQHFSGSEVKFTSHHGYAVTHQNPVKWPGKTFALLHAQAYKPAQLKKYLKKEGIREVWISTRDFSTPVKALRKKFNLSEGGDTQLLFTRLQASKSDWVFHVKRVL